MAHARHRARAPAGREVEAPARCETGLQPRPGAQARMPRDARLQARHGARAQERRGVGVRAGSGSGVQAPHGVAAQARRRMRADVRHDAEVQAQRRMQRRVRARAGHRERRGKCQASPDHHSPAHPGTRPTTRIHLSLFTHQPSTGRNPRDLPPPPSADPRLPAHPSGARVALNSVMSRCSEQRWYRPCLCSEPQQAVTEAASYPADPASPAPNAISRAASR
jgi:hypothetical protein